MSATCAVARAQFLPCAVVPVYDHERPVARVLAAIRAAGLPCFLVDDGSGPRCAHELERIAAHDPGTRLLRLPANRGKGSAVRVGLRAAAARGYTHALQIDADAQHCLADIPRFIAEARAYPQALVCGCPVFDETLPRVRRYGRHLGQLMVWLNTLSFAIRDSMCGFRVYPLGPVLGLLARHPLGPRMDFDVEILVRLHWRQQPLRWLDTRVTYPCDGVSHFRLLGDNARMVLMQVRLTGGMLLRLPLLLWRNLT
jgi:glycosyltransferase involved in cell wall biosynthesis